MNSQGAKRLKIAAGSCSNVFYVLAVQAIGLVWLDPREFGLFSIQYLVSALAASACLSTVAESWMREEFRTGYRSSWADFSNAAAFVSLTGACVCLATSLLITDLRSVALTGSAGVAFATYRVATRFFDVRDNRLGRAISGDLLGGSLALVVIVVTIVLDKKVGLGTITLAWVVAGASPLSLGGRPGAVSLGRARQWLADHKPSIVVLARDSVITDLGGIGTPLLLSPLIGVRELGVYRAMSNAASPVRLLVAPLRPTLAHMPVQRLFRFRHLAGILAASGLAGAACWAALALLTKLDHPVGTLSSLAVYADSVGVFVCGTFILHVFSMFARTNLGGTALLLGRLIQLILCLGLPVAFSLVGDLDHVLWAYAAAVSVSGLSWSALLAYRVYRPTES